MLCEKCGKNEATTWFRQTVNGKTMEMHLCPHCATEMHLTTPFGNGADAGPFGSLFNFGMPDLFGQLLGTASQEKATSGEEKRCPVCGMTERQLSQTGRVGCPTCYQTFREMLLPYIRKVHGATTHIGMTPSSPGSEKAPEQTPQPAPSPVDGLKGKLQQAISAENYEEAARLRDEIRRLEDEQK